MGGAEGWLRGLIWLHRAPTPTRNPSSAAVAALRLGGALRRASPFGLALELLKRREGQYVSLAELVAAAGISKRTLRTVFYETFGLGPARYLQLWKLHQIERALREANPEETVVAEVHAGHGVSQFGRCAGRYRRLFGELPSETLRRKPC